MLESARRCHPDVFRYCLVPEAECAALRKRLGAFADIRPIPASITGIPVDRMVSVARVFMVGIPADVVAYVDSDAIFCRPAPEIWEVPRGMVNAVQDAATVVACNLAGAAREAFIRQFPDAASRKGANSGMLALAPVEWATLPRQFEEAMLAGGYTYSPIIDQPLLNGIISPRFRWLPFEFNAHCLFDNPVPRGARIVHFTGSVKPWMPAYPRHEPAYWYWLKYGTPRASRARLLGAALWILACSPKRWIGRHVMSRAGVMRRWSPGT